MKRLSFLLAFMLITVLGFTQQRYIALHSNGEVSFFGHPTTAFNDAYTAAQTGDTLYLPGGLFAPPANFAKGLTIYGAGHYPDSTQATGKTLINGNVILKTGADNLYLEGIEITGNFQVGTSTTSTDSVENITVKRCKINGAISCQTNSSVDRAAFIQSVIVGNINFLACQNMAVLNCITFGNITYSNQNVFENNVFINNSYSSANSYALIGRSNNNSILNNIFIRNENIMVSGEGNTVKNNIRIAGYGDTWGTNGIISGNYSVARDDLFDNQSGWAFDYSHDYHLQSPETYPGTDGTQVGIYGGTYPYKEGAVPFNPHISTKFVAPQTNSSGELQIEINVNAQDE
ncbi:hypothetical protein LJC11_00790 [Bacteroidales bacterium OttesenSCG-928-I21]|nr:hypothetical protein [Bacteroidales bacterium OttesenSCG-928-I21]